MNREGGNWERRAGCPRKRTDQPQRACAGDQGEGEGECVGGRERQHQEPASQPASREGKAARRGGSTEGEQRLGLGREAERLATGRLWLDRWKGLEPQGQGEPGPEAGSGGK